MIHWFLKEQSGFLRKITLLALFLCAASAANSQTVDCSINANCTDPYCQFAANIEKGCNCYDNIDNDGDGKIDKADSNCATYYGLSFVGEGSDCSIVPPGANTPFDLVNAPITSDQNTADTQSKISVGDVDGDGIPDAVVTSKWNSEIRVIATAPGQADGTQPGDVKSDFKTTGQGAQIFSGSGGCNPKNLLFEHENLIADIDGDGKAELFGVVSNRGGNPSTPPTCFFLVAFTYAEDNLIPMYNAIQIGTDRPGTFGIADMDGDGKAEIYMRDRIYAAETGALLATGNGNWDLNVTAGPVAVDVVGDDKMELVCGTKIYSIPDFSNRTPATPANLALVADMNTIDPSIQGFVKLAIDPVEYGTDTHSMTSVADIDRDGNMDVVISGALGSETGPTAVFYWNVALGTVSYYLPTDPLYVNGWPWGTGRVNLGDANGDGKTDMLFMAGAYIHALTTDASGNLVPLWPTPRTINDSRSGVLTVSIYDFNNDGNPEVVYRDSQELVVIDGATGQTKLWSAVCQSHTYTEGVVIADVNGDGATDICVPCNTNNSFGINDPIQQQALGQFRLYYSSGNEWLPTRKVWNQPGYFVTNINDDLTLPFPQLDQSLIFGPSDCPNGLPGPQMPMNVFLNQVPFLSANGCPVYPAPDLSYFGDNPDNPGVDENGDGVYTPAVEVIPPICGDLAFQVRFNIVNEGDLPITGTIPVSFFKADPTVAGTTLADRLYTTSININNLQVDSTLTTAYETFNGTGGTFRLYIVLNNDGSTLPIDTLAPSPTECRLTNNVYSLDVVPDPFTTKIEKIADNFKCVNSAPDNGELRVRIFKAGVEVMDYSQYGFQWYNGTAASYTPIAGATNYNITGLAEGDYTAIVTNLEKGCVGIPVDTTIVRLGVDPEVVINVLSHQTVCNPPNGQLQAIITGGNTGFTFEWFDIALNPLGITGPTANNLVAGNYLVRVSRDGCTKNSLPETVDGPVIPDAQAATLQNVEDCLNPNSGIITATALFNGVAQDPANYTFEWYFYNNATATRGSILPGLHGTGETRTALPVGFYQVVVTDNATQCVAVQAPITEITSATIIPNAIITELAPLTSCDPANPNGRMQASVDIGGVIQDPSTFTFEWFEGDNTVTSHTDVSGVNGSIAESVKGGGLFYTVRVTTGNNCSDTEKLILTENLQVPIVTLTPTDNGICDPALATSAYNGTVTAAVTFDGAAVVDFTNYQIAWHNGSLATDPLIAGETAPLLDERNGGFYTAVVERTDLGCTSLPVTAQVVNAVALPVIETDSIASTNCAGGTPNGGVTVTSIVPADTYTYQWYDPSNNPIAGATTGSISGLQGGPGQNYTVEVTLGSTGCKNTFATAVPDNKLNPILSLTPSDNSICDGALGFNGSISSTFTDTNALAGHAYTYVWSTGNDLTNPIGGQTGPSLAQRNGGFYTATIRNTTLNCTSSPVTTEILNNQILPAIAAVQTPSTNCPGGADNGGITVSITNGVGGQTFAFEWHKGNLLTDPAVPALKGGNTATIFDQAGNQNYIVEATNNQTGCLNTLIQAISDASVVPVLTLTTTDNSICDPALGFNGTVTGNVATDINATGADTYSFVWSSGNDMTGPIAVGNPADPTLTGRNGGFYTVTVENDRLGCVSNPVTTEVDNNQILPALSAVQTPATNCPGGADNGGITVTVTNIAGAETYAFEWHKGNLMTDPAVPALKGGNTATIFDQAGNQNYIVEARNNLSGCENTLIQTISDASIVPALSLVTTDNSICDPALGFNGTVTGSVASDVNAIGGDTYSFVWSSGNDMTSPIAVGNAADPTLTGRNGGFYTVTIRNNRLNCLSSPVTAEVDNNQILPALSAVQTPSTNCPGGADNGGITVTVTNIAGAETYAFEWHKGNLMTDPAVPALKGGNTATIFDQAGNQNYIVEARNNLSGCENTLIQTIADASIVPALSLATTDNSICDPALGFNGTVTGSVASDVNAIGGDTYSFVWSSGNDMTSPIAVGNAADPTLTGRNGGFYTVTIRNNRLNCVSSPVTAEVDNNQILPALSAVQTPSTNCPGGADNGGITVTVTNIAGAETYAFEWHKGNLMTDPAVPALKGGNTATIFDQAGNQNYIVEARNNLSGCENTLIQTIADNSVVPVLTLLTTDNSICDVALGFNGTVAGTVASDVNAIGGDTYSYVWSNGNDMTSPIAVGNAADPTLTGRNGGFYTVTLENVRLNCVSNPVTAQVMNNQKFPALDAVATPSTNCPGGADNGAATVSVTNLAGAETFSFQWSKGNLVTDPDVPAGNGGNTTTINGQAGNQNYVVLVRNTQSGCENTFVETIPDNSEVPVLTLTPSPNSICDPGLGFNGSITQNTLADANALGTDTYTFAWATGNTMAVIIPGQTTLTLAGRDGGFYTATVRNNRLNCISNPVTVEILNDQILPAIAATPTPSTNCDPALANGAITVNVTNGLVGQTFSYEWHKGNLLTDPAVPAPDGGLTANIVRQQGGFNYTVEATIDQTGCVNTFTQSLQDISALPTLTLTPSPNTICVPNPDYNGSIASAFADANNLPAHVYQYAWSEGLDMTLPIGGNTPTLTLLNGGFYTATITNVTLGCTSNPATAEVSDNLILPVIDFIATPSTNCAGGTPNGAITASVTNGLGGQTFAYSWFRGNLNTDPAVAPGQGGNTPTVFGQQGGQNFTVEATINQTGCQSTETVLLQDDSEIPVINPLGHTDNVNCTAPFNGTAFVNAAAPFLYKGNTIMGPYAGFTLTWDGGTVVAPGDQTTVLAAGTYSLQVTAGAGNTVTNNNDNCISNPVSVTIVDDLTLPVVDVNVTDQTSCDPGATNGQLEAIETSGAGAYTIDWFSGVGVGAIGAGVPEVSDGLTTPVLASGNYSVLVANTVTRCETTITSFLPDNIVNPSINFNGITDVTDCANPNGAATPVLTDVSTNPTPDFTIYYVKTFSLTTQPASAPSDPAIIKTSLDTYSSTAAIVNGVNPPIVNNLSPGFLTALIVDNNTTCESSPTTIPIADATAVNQINVGLVVAAGFCGGAGGSIDITAAGGAGGYTYEWYSGTPSNADINFFTSPPDMTSAVFVTNDEDLGILNPLGGAGAGTYTVIVRDAVGCGAYKVDNVPFAGAPTITITPTDPTRCSAPFDGAVDVTVTGTQNYSIMFFDGNDILSPVLLGEVCDDGIDNDGDGDIDGADSNCNDTEICGNGLDDDLDGLTDAADPDCGNRTLTLPAVDAGQYLVRVIDYSPTNRPCPLDNGVILNQEGFAPIVQIDNITPNTACDDVGNADGQVQITVSQDGMDNRDPVVTPIAFEVVSVIPAPVNPPGVFPDPLSSGVSTVTTTLSYGFGPQTYTLRIREATSGCFVDQSVTVPDQPEVPQLLQVDVTNDTYCAPLSNGSAEVTAVNPIDIADYDYSWYTDNALTAVFYTAPGTGAGGGELLNAAKNVLFRNPVNGFGPGTREYYVQGIRRAGTGPGAGCPTPAIKVVVQDEHVNPVSVLTAVPNTSCDPVTGEGSISIGTTTASADPLVSGATYQYDLDLGGVPAGSLINRNGASALQFATLLDGTYNVFVTNETNGCLTNNEITITPLSLPTQISNFTFADQLICYPNGNIQVTQIQIDATGLGLGMQSYNAGLTGDFDFEWFRAAPATPGTFDPTQPLEDNTPADINRELLEPGTLAGQYPTMGAGTYYVVATRKVGPTPPVLGLGCPTPPLRVDIDNKRINPVVTLTSLSNTSCSVTTFEGQISVAVTDASPPAFGPFDDYNYAWGPVTSTTTPIVANPYTGVVATDGPFPGLEDGDYTVTVTNNLTGCATSATTSILKNTIPIFVTDTEIVDQFYCDPSGRLEVTEINYEDRNGAVQNAPVADFDFSWTRAGAPVGTALARLDSTALNYPAIGAGLYQVFATRTAGSPGLDCVSAPVNLEIKDRSVDPILTLTPFSNTSCTVAFEGEIEVDLIDASVPKVAPSPDAGQPILYSYTWVDTDGSGSAVPPVQAGQTGINNLYQNLEDGTYRLTAVNEITGCTTQATTTIIKNQTPVFVQDVTMVPQFYCDPSGNLNVVEVKFNDRDGVTQNGPLGDFTYTWSRTTLANVITTTNPAAPLAGHVGTELDSIVHATIGADIYYVVATRALGTPGAGCSSAPFRIDITDQRRDPVIALTPFSNTSCTVAFEGQIEVDVTDASVAKVPPAAFVYDYTWSAVSPVGLATPANQAGQSGFNNLYSGLSDGTYQLQVENPATGCVATATTTIIKNATPVFLTVVNPTPQFYCEPSGRLEVTGVTFTDRNGANQVGSISDFTFTWARGAVGANVATTVGNTPRGAFLDSLVYAGIGFDPNYYVVATRTSGSPGAGCASAPIKVEIVDSREYPTIALTPFSNTSCTVAFEGEIEVDITDTSVPKVAPSPDAGAPILYDYTWADVNAAGLALPPNQAGQNGANNLYQNLQDGVYRLTAVNTITGCSSQSTTTIIKNQTPVFLTVVNPTPQFYCEPSGRLEVTGVTFTDRNGANQIGAISDFTFTWARGAVGANVATTVGNTPRGAFLDSLVYAGIGFDPNYYVVATRTSGSPGAGCASAPIKAEIVDRREYPSIVLTPFSNTSCTVAFEGEIEVDITDTSVPKVAPSPDAGAPILYDYTWTDVNGAGLVLPPNQLGQNGTNNLYQNLQDGTYRLTTVNTITGCSSQSTTTIIKNQTPIFVQDVAMVPQLYCDPSGHLEVRSITYNDRDGASQNGPLTDFTFAWTRNDLVTGAGNTNGSLPRGTFLDSLSYAGPGTIGFGTYYVVATRNSGTPGAGCQSAPFKMEITDERENPVVNFTTLANTSCDNNFDGEITVLSSNQKAPGAGSTYDIQWITFPAGNVLTPANGVGASYTTPPTDAIGPGSFTVRVTNTTTNCASDAVVTMISNPQPVEILQVAKQDQLICFNDGSITVSAVNPALVADYSFNWFRNASNTTALVDAGNATITSSTLDVNNYSSIAADRYFVVGQKSTAGGSGCLTPPFRVDLLDLHVDPNLSLTFSPNSSCNVTNPNGQLIATAIERDGSTDNYTFAWTLNAAPLPAVTTQTDATPNSQLDDAFEGQYVLIVTNTLTGCSFASGVAVDLDHNVSLPNIITVDTVDPTTCIGDGSAEVTAISIGGGPSITGPVLGTDFQYEWYDDNFVPANQLPTTTPLLSPLASGTYYVRVQDLTTDCKSSPTEVVILEDDIIYPLLNITQTAAQISCITTAGTAALLATGDGQTDANPTYLFNWFNNLDATAPAMATTSTIIDLLDGDYSVTVTNTATGCTSQDLYIIRDDSDRFMPILSLTTEGRIDCLNPDGSLQAREVGWSPTSGYPYPINFTAEVYPGQNADVTQPGTVMNFVPGFNRNWLSDDLDVGFFTVKLTDNNTGCFVTGMEEVLDQRVNPVVIVLEDNPLINCDPARANGQLSATADGGKVGGYLFDWYTGATASGVVLGTNNKLIGLGMGDYTVRVTNDFTNCFADATRGITDGRLPAPTPVAELIFDRTRCDFPDGWVAANVGGITFNYTFDWYDGEAVKPSPDFIGSNYRDRDIGFYTVTAMDQTTGCLSLPTSIEVKDLRVIPEVIIHTTPSYCEELPGQVGGTGTAEIELVPANVATDAVSWSLQPDLTTIGIGSYLTNILPGFYQADVVTSQGCTSSGVGEVATEVFAYNLVSNNGDLKNDNFRIDCISQFPNNNVKIFNRSGVLVYEANGYDNVDVIFKGIGENGVYTIGNELPVGTYFYIIDKRDGSKPKTGYLELVR